MVYQKTENWSSMKHTYMHPQTFLRGPQCYTKIWIGFQHWETMRFHTKGEDGAVLEFRFPEYNS